MRTTEPQISHFPCQTWTQRRCLTCPEWWHVYCREELRVSRPAKPRPLRARHCGRWRVERLCAPWLETFSGQNQPMGALLRPHSGRESPWRWWQKQKELIVIGQRSMTSAGFVSALFCSAGSGTDQSQDNLDNLLPPPGLMGNDVSFLCFVLFFCF